MEPGFVRRTITVLAAFVVVAGCASPANRVSGARRSTTSAAALSTSLASLAGTAWRLTAIADGTETIALTNSGRPELDFGHDGTIVLDDTVNTLSAKYTVDDGGITTSDAASTAVAYAGSDPTRVATIAAVDSLVYEFTHGTSLPTTNVAVTLTADVLHI
ncbi:MAG: hypothetical protein JWO57_2632, partial [Pseudonocardiales bacterium]|nr:hypothetical protein [Pseudonocardiales bacterium]